jgi:hypothetical protein
MALHLQKFCSLSFLFFFFMLHAAEAKITTGFAKIVGDHFIPL